MPQIINTNVASLNAQRNLNASQAEANKSLQRLSSGLRINSAKDDAAGLAISNRLTSQINGINQAIRNANDGISVAQVAEGALGETTNILQRMRELAIQSANASNSPADRAALQAEVDELITEVDRIASSTAFGATKLLDGSFTDQNFQVGAQKGETIAVNISGAGSEDLAVKTVDFTGFNSAEAVSNTSANIADPVLEQTLTFDVNGTESTVAVAAGDSAKTIAATINSDVAGLSAEAQSKVELNFATAVDDANDTISFTLGGTTYTKDTTETLEEFAAEFADVDGITVEVGTSGSNDTLTITDTDGDDIELGAFDFNDGGNSANVTATSLDFSDTAAGTAATLTATNNTLDVKGDIQFTTLLADDATFSLESTSGTGGLTSVTDAANGGGTITYDAARQVADIDISTVEGANQALDIVDSALAIVDNQRADLGAAQNRLESVISNLANVSENSAAARARIRDADFAQETAALAKAQILQQAGISVLAQANASSQNVLALLQ